MPGQRTQLKFIGRDLWYLVGLVSTDGSLSSDGRHIDITSKDREFLDKIKITLGFQNKIGIKRYKNRDKVHYRIQISNKNLYEFMVSIGLTPNKSLSLGALAVPDEWFSDFVRGVIDGDGSIRRWIHPSNGGEQWSLRVYSASSVFIHWLCQRVEKHFLATGKIHNNTRDLFVLKYGKLATKQILNTCYYDGCLSLDRKARLAKICCLSKEVWRQSKTLLHSV